MDCQSHDTGDSLTPKGKRSSPEPAEAEQHSSTEPQDDLDNDDPHQKYIKRDELEEGNETPENSTTTSDRLPWSNEVGEDEDDDSRRGEDFNSSLEDDEGSQSEAQDGEKEKDKTKNGQCIEMNIESSKSKTLWRILLHTNHAYVPHKHSYTPLEAMYQDHKFSTE
eukprot:gene50686-67856_t